MLFIYSYSMWRITQTKFLFEVKLLCKVSGLECKGPNKTQLYKLPLSPTSLRRQWRVGSLEAKLPHGIDSYTIARIDCGIGINVSSTFSWDDPQQNRVSFDVMLDLNSYAGAYHFNWPQFEAVLHSMCSRMLVLSQHTISTKIQKLGPYPS